jgi:hypothetical protein
MVSVHDLDISQAWRYNRRVVGFGLEQLGQLADAGERFVDGAQSWRNGRAAQLLYHAGVIEMSLKAYDYECRATYKPLLDYQAEWPEDRRTAAWDQVERFVEARKIYPYLKKHLPAMERYLRLRTGGGWAAMRRFVTPNDQQKAAADLVEAATEYQSLMATIRYNKGKWQTTIKWHEFSKTEVVRRHAHEMYDPIRNRGWELLDTADRAYGIFQDDIIRHHTKLIDWKRIMSNLSDFPEA